MQVGGLERIKGCLSGSLLSLSALVHW